MASIGKESIWKELKGQVLLGSKEYIEKFIEFVKKVKEKIKDIPRNQRYLTRPSHKEIFNDVMNDKYERGKKLLKI